VAEAESPAGTPERARVLVIDDERMITVMLRRLLAPEHEVLVANHGAEALAHFARGERFDLVLCDIMMPTVSGMDLYRSLEREHPEQAQRVVFLTGGTSSPEIRRFVDQFPERLIEKPFDTAELRTFVRERLAHWRRGA
jgi:CheY-like chemotaxis protein